MDRDEPDPPDDPVVVPIEEVIDLHGFLPRDILGVVDAYLDAARERGLTEVRLIHGRGKGVQRAQIARALTDDPRIRHFEEAPPGRGGWGATLVWLHALDDADPPHESEPSDPSDGPRSPRRVGRP